MCADQRKRTADQRTRKSPASIIIPSPFPLAPAWADRYPREITVPEAARITRRSLTTARGWARGEPIEPLALHVLQLHLWDQVMPTPWRLRGLRFWRDHITTRTGYQLTATELEAYAWVLTQHKEATREALGLTDLPDPEPRPARRWRPSKAFSPWLRRKAGQDNP